MYSVYFQKHAQKGLCKLVVLFNWRQQNAEAVSWHKAIIASIQLHYRQHHIYTQHTDLRMLDGHIRYT